MMVVVMMVPTISPVGLRAIGPVCRIITIMVVVAMMVVVMMVLTISPAGLRAIGPVCRIITIMVVVVVLVVTMMVVVVCPISPIRPIRPITTILRTTPFQRREAVNGRQSGQYRLKDEDGRSDEESQSTELHDGFLGGEG